MLIHDKNKQIVLSRNAMCQYKKLFFFIGLFSSKMINVMYTVCYCRCWWCYDNLRIIDIVKNIQLPLANSQREIMHFIQRFDGSPICMAKYSDCKEWPYFSLMEDSITNENIA